MKQIPGGKALVPTNKLPVAPGAAGKPGVKAVSPRVTEKVGAETIIIDVEPIPAPHHSRPHQQHNNPPQGGNPAYGGGFPQTPPSPNQTAMGSLMKWGWVIALVMVIIGLASWGLMRWLSSDEVPTSESGIATAKGWMVIIFITAIYSAISWAGWRANEERAALGKRPMISFEILLGSTVVMFLGLSGMYNFLPTQWELWYGPNTGFGTAKFWWSHGLLLALVLGLAFQRQAQDNTRTFRRRETNWVALILLVGLLGFVVWMNTSRRLVSDRIAEVTPARVPMATISITTKWSEVINVGYGRTLLWELLESDVPLMTRINGEDDYVQAPRSSPVWTTIQKRDDLRSISWRVATSADRALAPGLFPQEEWPKTGTMSYRFK